jgi:hypothetical protein
MEETVIRDFFRDQVRAVIGRSAGEPEGFLAYFAEHEPKDEEILGLLAVSSMMSGEFRVGSTFPTPVEALAALSSSSRLEICREFREALKSCLRRVSAA